MPVRFFVPRNDARCTSSESFHPPLFHIRSPPKEKRAASAQDSHVRGPTLVVSPDCGGALAFKDPAHMRRPSRIFSPSLLTQHFFSIWKYTNPTAKETRRAAKIILDSFTVTTSSDASLKQRMYQSC
jgi:hypothetical protein